jgi:hypothetical protein
MKNLVQGRFTPKYPSKYIGNVNDIVYRSSWERVIFHWVDKNPAVLEWCSEELVIPYYNPLDKMQHRYFPDIFARIQSKDRIRECVIEIKPLIHSIRPVVKKQRKKTLNHQMERYVQNAVKWQAADHYCKQRGWEFILLCDIPNTRRFARRDDVLEAAIQDAHRMLTG